MTQASTLGFVGGPFDRAGLKRTDEAWLAAALGASGTRFILFRDDRPMIDVSGDAPVVLRLTATELDPPLSGTEPVLLSVDADGNALFAVQSQLGPEDSPADDIKLIDLRSLALQGLIDAADLGTLAHARSLLYWHARHRYCANCGTMTEPVEAGYKRVCGSCQAQHFPRTDPVAILLVEDGDRLLLGRGAHFVEGMYSALAGFIEPGETIEDAARREVKEEAGIVVGAVRYVASQPWPFPSSLMIGLIGEAETSEIDFDRAELEDCRWFPRDEVRLMLKGEHPDGLKTPMPMAIAHHLVRSLL